MDVAGNLYIADYGNQRVRAIAANETSPPSPETVRAGDTGDGGPATAAMLLGPRDIATDKSGNLYISELTDTACATYRRPEPSLHLPEPVRGFQR